MSVLKALNFEKAGSERRALEAVGSVLVDSSLEASTLRIRCNIKVWNMKAAQEEIVRLMGQEQSEADMLWLRLKLSETRLFLGSVDEASILVDICVEKSKEKGNHALLNEAMERRAEILLLKQDYQGVRAALEEARAIPREKSEMNIFEAKWRAILEAFESADPVPLLRLKYLAQIERRWELARQSDFLRLRVQFDEETFNHLYFGTPSEDYREVLKKEFKRENVSESYTRGEGRLMTMNMATGDFTGPLGLVPGKKLHLILRALFRDFYRPSKLPDLAMDIYPGQPYVRYLISGRLHQSLFRLRQWLMANSIPISIETQDNEYQGVQGDGLAIHFSLNASVRSPQTLLLESLERTFDGRAIQTHQVCRELGISRSKCQRLLRWAVSEGHLVKSGEFAEQSYRFTPGIMAEKPQSASAPE